jgi:hypothetical protein
MSKHQIPYAEYALMNGANWSTLKHMRKSPLHYKSAIEAERKDNTRMALGRGAHTAVLEPMRFLRDYVLWEEGIRRGKAWDAFKDQNSTKTILKPEEYQLCLDMAAAVKAHPVAADYFAAGVPESTIRWTDEQTGIECKGRPDWLSASRDALVDLKTTADVDAHAFAGVCARMAYHCQLAFYAEGLKRSTGRAYPVVIVAVEQKPPHDVAVFEVDEDALYAGWEECQALLTKLSTCRRENHWPGRYQDRQTLRLPAWIWPDDESDTAIGDDLNFGATTGE